LKFIPRVLISEPVAKSASASLHSAAAKLPEDYSLKCGKCAALGHNKQGTEGTMGGVQYPVWQAAVQEPR
jgi:hypothetical protein